MNCAQVKEQLIDFLYGELPAKARDAFAEHLHGCPACKAEVASYQRTLGSARTALAGPLLEEAPARVHLSVIEAAKAAAKQAAQAKAKAKATTPQPRNELGLLARLWRTPWFLPAFGAASIATVVFLVRVIKNPEVLPGQRPRSIDERSLSLPLPVLPPEPTMATEPAAPPPAVEAKTDMNLDPAKRKTSASGAPRRVAAKGVAGAGAQRQFAEPPPPRQAAKKSSRDFDDFLAGGNDTEAEQPPVQPMVAPAARPAAAPAPKMMRDYPAESAASAPAPAAPPAYRHKELKQEEEVQGSAEAAYDDLAQDLARDSAKDKRAKSGNKPGLSLDESLSKAERLYASQDWNAAAAAYRDLISRFPNHRDAPRWRDRMNESSLAYQRTLEARRKKAASDDPLSGSMK